MTSDWNSYSKVSHLGRGFYCDVEPMIAVRMRLSHFDPVGPLQDIQPDFICSDYAIELARDGVTQSVSMIKNDK